MNDGMKYGAGLMPGQRLARLEQALGYEQSGSGLLIPKGLLTTRGDLIRRGASAPERVALGATGKVFTSNGTDPGWDAVPGLGVWRTIIHGDSGFGAGVGAGTRFLCVNPAEALGVSGGANFPRLFVLDDVAITGYTCQVRMIGHVHTNATAPGITFTFGLQTVGPTGGGAGAIGWGLTGSAACTAAVATPALTTMPRTVGVASSFSGHASSPYALYVTTNGTTAANSFTGVHWDVQMRWIPT